MLKKSFLKYYFSFLIFGIILILNTGRANAATLSVDNNCSLPKAISAIQAASDDVDCIKTGDSYGTDDTVNIPSGTITLSADLPTINKNLTIIGSGKSSTIIDANGSNAFDVNNSDSALTRDFTIRDLKIKNAVPGAIKTESTRIVTISSVEVENSYEGINISNAMNVSVNSSFIHDNNNGNLIGDNSSGLVINIVGLDSTDIPSASISDTTISGNLALNGSGGAGLGISMNDGALNGGNISSNSVTTHNVTVLGNQASVRAGLIIENVSGPLASASTALLIDATTIANNSVIITTPIVAVPGVPHIPVNSGVYLSGKLTSQQNFTNVTVANNSTNSPLTDDRNTIAGFFGTLNHAGAPLTITNATVVNNLVNQPSSNVSFSAFLVVSVELDQFYAPVTIEVGATSRNGLIAHNLRNGIPENCTSLIDLTALGLPITIDATPTNLGNNLSDDQTCSGYTEIANLYDTIEHDVADNGGSVPTIALLDGSPAINAGEQVLGIFTDARGIARPSSTVSVGAYQYVQGANITAPNTISNSGGTLADTGVNTISTILLLGIIISSILYIIIDHREHKKPLKKENPNVRYTIYHHIKKVIIPLVKYRLSFKLDKISINRN